MRLNWLAGLLAGVALCSNADASMPFVRHVQLGVTGDGTVTLTMTHLGSWLTLQLWKRKEVIDAFEIARDHWPEDKTQLISPEKCKANLEQLQKKLKTMGGMGVSFHPEVCEAEWRSDVVKALGPK